MALSDFFRINLPYGIKRNPNGEWMAFNREYVPLGWNTTVGSQSVAGEFYAEFPIYTKYLGVTEKKLLQLALGQEESLHRDGTGKIDIVFFYNDSTNPQSNKDCWEMYFEKIKLLSTLTKKQA